MTTEIQAEANRRNALQSTGPRTSEGIEAARFNALRHGLRSLQTIIPGEDPELWEAHRAGVVEDLKPVGAVELALAEQIAAKLWRLGRVVRHEADLIASDQCRDEVLRAHEIAVPKSSFSSFSGTLSRDKIPNARDLREAQAALTNREEKLKSWEVAYSVLEALEGFKDSDTFSKEEWPIYEALKEDLELPRERADGLFKTEDENFAVHHARTLLGFRGDIKQVTEGMLTYWRDEKIPELRAKVKKAQGVVKRIRRRYEAALERVRMSRGLPNDGTLNKIQRYEAHLERGLHKALERLQTLQEARGIQSSPGVPEMASFGSLAIEGSGAGASASN
jgi:hypothetical protein